MAIYAEVAGEGPALVLVHEGICDSRMWDDAVGARTHASPPCPPARPARLRPLAARAGHLLARARPDRGARAARLRARGADRRLARRPGRARGRARAAGPRLGARARRAGPARPRLVGGAAGRAGARRRRRSRRRPRRGGRGEPAHLGRRAAAQPEDVDPAVRARVGEMQRRAYELQRARRRGCRGGAARARPRRAARRGAARRRSSSSATRTVPDMQAIAERLEREIPGARRATIADDGARAEHGAATRVRRARAAVPAGGRVSTVAPAELVARIWERDPTALDRATTRRSGSAGWTSRCGCAAGSATCERFVEDARRARADRHLRPARNGRLEPRARGDQAQLRRRVASTCSTRRTRQRSGAWPRRSTSTRRSSSPRPSPGRRSRRARTSTSSGSAPASAASSSRRSPTPARELEQLAQGARLPRDLRRRADDRRALLGAVGLRARARPR